MENNYDEIYNEYIEIYTKFIDKFKDNSIANIIKLLAHHIKHNMTKKDIEQYKLGINTNIYEIAIEILTHNPKYIEIYEFLVKTYIDLDQLFNKIPKLIKYAHKILTYERCYQSVTKIPKYIKYVPFEYQMDSLCLYVLNVNGMLLKYIKNKNQELINIAISNNKFSKKYITTINNVKKENNNDDESFEENMKEFSL